MQRRVGSSGPFALQNTSKEGADLIVNLAGDQLPRDMAQLAQNPQNVISTVDGTPAHGLAGSDVVRITETLEKITDVIKYRLAAPHVRPRSPLVYAQEAMVSVDFGLLDPVPQRLGIDAELLYDASVGADLRCYVLAGSDGLPRGSVFRRRGVFRFRWHGLHPSGYSMSPSNPVRSNFPGGQGVA